jgi:hypothetical protein
MPRKKSNIIKYIKKAQSSKKVMDNPSVKEAKAMAGQILPGLGSFVGTNIFISLTKRFEARLGPLGKHAAPIAAVLALITVAVLTTKVKSLKKYQEPILIGAGIATTIAIVNKYMPGLGWLIGGGGASVGSTVPKGVGMGMGAVSRSRNLLLPPDVTEEDLEDDEIEWAGDLSGQIELDEEELGAYGGSLA